ncbi:LacI family DNA-binding transcriptional regulator [Selenomonas sp. TAMA-11512]|uniref:LacI family DNA-binding transcriptional regulator n=1 Tax=Selenomonas sp. TAMA-11512 TaxID=3095337 RepID=UPI003093658E|nr:LacI family DNA-binding transcriptional regulator [Selenomonas sp. TAMA-11512]
MTIYDIARETGVSIATVSRVVNNKGYVSQETRDKIQKALERSKYQPSAIARGLATGSMKTVAILVVDVRVPHYAMTTYIMEDLLSKEGYAVLVCNTNTDMEKTSRYLRMLGERNVDGIILVGSVYRDLCTEDALQAVKKIPLILANGKLEQDNAYSVLVDEGYGIGLAAEQMLRTGHTHLAYVADLQTESSERKQKGFCEAMERAGARESRQHIFHTEYGMDGGRDVVERICQTYYDEEKHIPYDGIVCGEDLTAVGVLYALQEKGFKVPQDIAVSGCNNSEYAYICNPKLTTINNKGELLSRLTVELLIEILTEGEQKAERRILPELTVQETT